MSVWGWAFVHLVLIYAAIIVVSWYARLIFSAIASLFGLDKLCEKLRKKKPRRARFP
ncbi:MAG TPA: hypothetical protein VK660_07185 [Xanthomonadaceae bacterium]|jgi:hypothetical protein|nr:hypothetical protein [Xanthomonadaceae bacterium]